MIAKSGPWFNFCLDRQPGFSATIIKPVYMKKYSRKPSVIGKFQLKLDGVAVKYVLKRSPVARLVWLRVTQNGLTVTVPGNYPIKNLEQFLSSRSKWILKHLNKRYKEVHAANQIPELFSTVKYLGVEHHVTRETDGKGHSIIRLELPESVQTMCTGGIPGSELKKWLIMQSAEVIQKTVVCFCRLMKADCNRIFIRDQKTRWGSCSNRKNLNFNWRLIMAPEEILDYVVIHEICHIKEMNHSEKFWKMVAEYCPDWKEKRNWLNKHGADLRVAI